MTHKDEFAYYAGQVGLLFLFLLVLLGLFGLGR